jgi:protein TonB
MRLALLSLATLGAIAIAAGFYIAMNPAHRPLSWSAASKPAVVRTTALEELPETDITVGNNSASKRNEAARRGRDARSAASPQSPETSSVEAAAGDTSAVVLSPPAPISTGNVPEEVSPPALNISDSIATMSEATPPAALPTLSSPPRIEPSLPARRPEHVRPARLLRKIDPIYPPAAFAAAISGTVVLQARIAADGRVEAVDVLRGTGVFTPAAVNAVRSWKYQPAEVDGRPVESTVVVTINFFR